MKVIGFYSIKGGVGKTAGAVNVAYLASAAGLRTVLCDLDPQGSSSFYYRIRPARKGRARRLFGERKRIDDALRGTDFERLDLLPAHMSFRNLDIILSRGPRRKKRLRDILSAWADEYDIVVLDCPPNITLVSENVFRAADLVVVPVVPTPLSRLTYGSLLEFFADQELDVSRIVAFFSMVEVRKKLHRETMGAMRENDGRFLSSFIPYLSDIERMGVEREPVVHTQPRSPASRSYRLLWLDLSQRLGIQVADPQKEAEHETNRAG